MNVGSIRSWRKKKGRQPRERKRDTQRIEMQRAMLKSVGSSGRTTMDTEENEKEEENAIASFQAREEEIQKKKMEVKEKVELHLGRAEEETRRLSQIWEELEVMADPSKKEVSNVRKRIDTANRELKSLSQSCQKKEKEYKDLMEIFKEKSREKSHLIDTLMELLRESERSRLKKLEEMSKILESLH